MYLAGYNEIMEIEIELYETASGHCPFDDWFEARDRKKISATLS